MRVCVYAWEHEQVHELQFGPSSQRWHHSWDTFSDAVRSRTGVPGGRRRWHTGSQGRWSRPPGHQLCKQGSLQPPLQRVGWWCMYQHRAAGTRQGPSGLMGILGRRGRGRAAGPAGGWPHSRAAAGRTHKPRGRCCRLEVSPEEEAFCPPSHPM